MAFLSFRTTLYIEFLCAPALWKGAVLSPSVMTLARLEYDRGHLQVGPQTHAGKRAIRGAVFRRLAGLVDADQHSRDGSSCAEEPALHRSAGSRRRRDLFGRAGHPVDRRPQRPAQSLKLSRARTASIFARIYGRRRQRWRASATIIAAHKITIMGRMNIHIPWITRCGIKIPYRLCAHQNCTSALYFRPNNRIAFLCPRARCSRRFV